MVSTRARHRGDTTSSDQSPVSSKRSAPSESRNLSKSGSKRVKKEKDGKLEVGNDGEVGLKHEDHVEPKEEINEEVIEEREKDEQRTQNDNGKDAEGQQDAKAEIPEDKKPVASEKEDVEQELKRSGPGETTQEGDETTVKEQEASAKTELDEPKHGTVESGHIYFIYRPKIDSAEVDSLDDVFHILLIPTSAPHHTGHYHRIIEVGKKKLPDPGARYQVIWGLVGSVGSDRGSLKKAFGEYSYETKTRGTRHQAAARPAARGHYILHSPRDELADDPAHDRQRDFKCLLAYEITTPAAEDFGNVQSELGLEPKGAVVIQVKDPDAQAQNNPRAANIPRERRAQYPPRLMSLFNGRRFIPANPPSFLSYSGAEILIITSPHELSDSLGKSGKEVEADMDHAAQDEAVGIQEALKELGMSGKDTEIEALEGAWA
ncbi:MAG: hypothetical protein TREMPRED_006054 [Tremellales sp. Tagirdzhanova-0007]|nr:MAG: hypothetical protein TREMPRED_006054 [Tremellales sp. Tagirdzhanova-0007]